MSDYVRVDIEIVGDELDSFNPRDVDRVVNRIKEYVTAHGYAENWVADLREAVEGKTAEVNHWHVEVAEDFMKFVSEGFPETLFGVRGVGEELEDMWLRYFRNGIIYRERPEEES